MFISQSIDLLLLFSLQDVFFSTLTEKWMQSSPFSLVIFGRYELFEAAKTIVVSIYYYTTIAVFKNIKALVPNQSN